jgi:predicted nucleic acid-binding protein
MSSSPLVWFTPLHLAECAHAFAQHVFLGKLSPSAAEEFGLLLEKDRASGFWLGTEMPEDAFEVCANLARRHGQRLGMRTLDSLHVACALQLKAEQFWSFDDRQTKLAKAAGLEIS